ncbi:di-trans,poly-cis-decaprenylcistransferase [Candidatus Dependentiae bacterium]|nr:di-trans,poly-cis-decaprenylcistransferase [Candidatus Dependentiae bacterium]
MSYWLLVLLGLLCIPLAHKMYTHSAVQSSHTPANHSIQHLGVIMDGNRRWASQKNLARSWGYRHGTNTLRTLVRYCLEHSIKIVSVYAFSMENFKRDPSEIEDVFKLFVEEANKSLPELIEQKVTVRFLGDKNIFPQSILPTLKKVEERTADGSHLQLNVLFCYSGRQEIISAIKTIVQDIQEKKITEVPDEEGFKKYLWTKNIPDPDLIIRTGGCKRLSNFMPYQATYSELYFVDNLWPDLTTHDLDAALNEYTKRTRTFGI